MMSCPYCGISLMVHAAGNTGLYFCYMCCHAFDRDDIDEEDD